MAQNETNGRRGNSGSITGIPMPFLDDMPDAARTFLDRNAELHSEFLNLWSHRAQAWLNWPKQMLACKDPGDLTEAHGRFLTTMQRHYRDYFDSVLKDPLVQPEPVEAVETKPSGPAPGPESKGPQRKEQDHRKAA